MKAAALLSVLAFGCAHAVERDVVLNHEITWVDTLPPSYKLAGAEYLSHGWDVVRDVPLPSPIFQFTYGGLVDPQANTPDSPKTMEMMGTNDVFFIPDQCEAKPHGQCEFSASSEVYTSATKYARSLAVSAGVSAEIAVLGAFSASASFESASEGMQEGEKDMFILKAECLASGIELTKPTGFHPLFAKAFASLPETFGPEDSDLGWKAYSKFFETFGTHVITKADLGGVLRQTTFVSKSTVASKSSSAIAASLEASLSAGFGSASASVGGSYAKEDSSETSSSSMESKITTEGGQPGSAGDGANAAWGSWAATVPTHPVPVHRRMAALGDLLGYDATTDSAKGEAAEALCAKAELEQGACFKRIASVYRGMRRYVKERAKGQSTTYAVYVHFAEPTEEEGGAADPAHEKPVPADIPSAVRESLPAGALDRMSDEVAVCSFECLRARTLLPDTECEPGMPVVKVMESQAKGCASAPVGDKMVVPGVAEICKARNTKCDSPKAILRQVDRMPALKAAGEVDAVETGNMHKAIGDQLLSATICQMDCIKDDPTFGRAAPCLGNDGRTRIAYVPETELPRCHVDNSLDKLAKSDVLRADKYCGGCGVPNKARFKGSFRGDPKNPQATVAQIAALAQGPANKRTETCVFECGKCSSAEAVVVTATPAQVPGCPNLGPGGSSSAAPVVNQCKEYNCKASSATFLHTALAAASQDQTPAPGVVCKFECACGKQVSVIDGLDVAGCKSYKAGKQYSDAAVHDACARLQGCEDSPLTSTFKGADQTADVYNRFAARRAWLSPADGLQMNRVSRTPRRLQGKLVTVSQSEAAVAPSMRAAAPALSFVQLEAVGDGEYPVLDIYGELGEIEDWQLGDTQPDALAVGKLAKFTRNYPGVGAIRSINLALPATLPVRLLRVTDVDAGVEYIFDVKGAGTFENVAPVRMDSEENPPPEVPQAPVQQVSVDLSDDQVVSSDDQAQLNGGEEGQVALVELAAQARPIVPLVVSPAMQGLYAQLDERRSFNRYDFFLDSSASQFIHERGDVVVTLTGDSGSVSLPVSIYQERYWPLLGKLQSLPDADLPNALYVKSRTPLFRNFKQATDKDRRRIAFFAYEGSAVGTLRTVQVQVRKAVRPAVTPVQEATYEVQRRVAQQICYALLGDTKSARPTDDCTTLTGENKAMSKWPNLAFIARDNNVVGLGKQHCETVKAVLTRGNDRFQCQFEGEQWWRMEQTEDFSKSTNKIKAMSTSVAQKAKRWFNKDYRYCMGHGEEDLCDAFFATPKGYFSGADAETDITNMRYVHVREIKVVDYRSRRAYFAQFDTAVNEFAAATRDLL